MHFKPFQKPEKTFRFLICPTLQIQHVIFDYWIFLLLPLCLVVCFEHLCSENTKNLWMLCHEWFTSRVDSVSQCMVLFASDPSRWGMSDERSFKSFQALYLVTNCQMILRWQEVAVNKHVCLRVSYRLAIFALCKMLHISFSTQLVLPKRHLSQITQYLLECLVFSFCHVSGADFFLQQASA